MSRSNVLRFPNDPASGRGVKAFAIVMYLTIAFKIVSPIAIFYMIKSSPAPPSIQLSGDVLGFILMLGVLYGLVIRQWHKHAPILREKPWVGIVIGVLLAMSLLKDLPILIVLAIFYWLLVARSRREPPYFLRFHILTAIIANGLLLLPFLIFQAIIAWIESLSQVIGLSWVVSFTYWYAFLWPMFTSLVFWGGALWLSYAVMMGRTPYMPTVTDNVRHWA